MKLSSLAALLLLGCARPANRDDATVYTLVRSSAADQIARELGGGGTSQPPLRIHVATFDADESAAYNGENCEVAARLFESQPAVTVKYWCEKGRFRR